MVSHTIPCLKSNCLSQNPLGTKLCQRCGTSLILSDRYEIQQQLAKNAGRQTLLARDWQTEQLVVIKILSFGRGFEWDDLKLFQREAETLKALSHLAIPCYLDYFELSTEDGFALLQTYVEGRSLEAHLQAGRSFDDIDKLELNKGFFKKDSDKVKPRIIIWAGTKKYEFGGDGWLSEPELDWLVHELSYWLGLPVTPA